MDFVRKKASKATLLLGEALPLSGGVSLPLPGEAGMISALWEIIQDANKFAHAPGARLKTIGSLRKGPAKRRPPLPKSDGRLVRSG
jgi:hypothetical protein